MSRNTKLNISCEANHQTIHKVHAKLNEFRQANVFCDVVIVVEDRKFPCHRNVLSAASDYFQAMFTSDFQENKSFEVTMHDINANTFEQILHFMYTAEIYINDGNVSSLLTHSEYLGLEYIEDLCIAYINNRIPMHNIAGILFFASRTNKLDLVDKLYEYMAENFINLSRTDELSRLSVDELKTILTHNNVRTNPDATIIFLTKWAKEQPDDIKESLSKLLQYVDFKNISVECMAKVLTNEIEVSSELQNETEAELNANQVQSCAKSRPSLKLIASIVKKFVTENEETNTLFACVFEITERMNIRAKPAFDLLFMTSTNFSSKSIAMEGLLYNYCYNSVERSNCWLLNDVSNFVPPNVTHLKKPNTFLSKPIMASAYNNIYFYSPHVKDTNMNDRLNANVNMFYVYNCNRDMWFSYARMSADSVRVRNPCLVSMDNSLYLIGGSVPSNSVDVVNWAKDSLAQHYDLRTNRWNRLPNSLFEHIDAAACVYDGKIYVTGGDYLSYHKKVVEVFDPVASKWCALACMPIKKKSHFMVSHEEYIYAIGGKQKSSEGDVNDFSICVYHAKRNKWTNNFTLSTCRGCFKISEICGAIEY